MLNTMRHRLGLVHAKSWFSIQAKAATEESEIFIYDYIGFDGVTAADFVRELKAITTKKITLRINTDGGNVFDGLTIYNNLKDHGAEIHVKVDGLAASIGSIIAMAGHTITMSESSFLMIHNPWALAIGNANDMRGMADTLEKIGWGLAGIYARRAKTTKEQAKTWMDGETWFTAEGAKAAGLADVIYGSEADHAQAKTQFDLSGYANVPDVLKAGARDSAIDRDLVAPTVALQNSGIQLDADSLTRAAVMRKRLALVERGESSR